MYEIKTALKNYILDILSHSNGNVPSVLPDLIKQYEDIDVRYPDCLAQAENANEVDPEDKVKELAAEISELLIQLSTDGVKLEVLIREGEAFLHTKDYSGVLPKLSASVIYDRERGII